MNRFFFLPENGSKYFHSLFYLKIKYLRFKDVERVQNYRLLRPLVTVFLFLFPFYDLPLFIFDFTLINKITTININEYAIRTIPCFSLELLRN